MVFSYLWRHRLRPPTATYAWFKIWAKRILNTLGLLRIMARRRIYQLKGASLGDLSIICKIDFNGPLTNLKVGKRSFVGANVHLALHEYITLGNQVCVNDGVHFLTASHNTNDPKWLMWAKPIVVNDYAWIAYNAIILPGVTIGKGAVIGAGAVVSKDVADYDVVAGNPALVVKQRCESLDYSPVDLCAAYEAWLGKKTNAKNIETGTNG